jgi:hypothetical protein
VVTFYGWSTDSIEFSTNLFLLQTRSSCFGCCARTSQPEHNQVDIALVLVHNLVGTESANVSVTVDLTVECFYSIVVVVAVVVGYKLFE